MHEPTDSSVGVSAQDFGPLPGRPRAKRRSQRQIEESVEIKAAIVRAALVVFAQRGYTQTTLEAVAKTVGLTRSGILHHFSSKDALFQAVLELQMSWAQQQAEPAGGDPALGGLAAFLGKAGNAQVPLQLAHVLEGEAIAGNAAAAEHVRGRAAFVEQEVRRRLAIGLERGEVAADVDPDAAATLVTAAINGLQAAWLLEPATDTERAFELLLRLLAPSAGAADA
ncbi:TetR/AcrR family transcriptional regulator [Dactylosporangium sp. McL0621]|uniref:TetR/AcrR family transcriptional regulator n=1 Tax=Dactylosporangium sp. McL0621 TaxID=3415678 RepID=UPI003CEDA831